MSFTPSALRRIEKNRIGTVSASTGTSPRTFTIQLPKYGVYDFLLTVGYGNPQSIAVVTGRIIWFKNDGPEGSGVNANVVAKTLLAGPAALSAPPTPAPPSPSVNDLTSLTVSDPSSSGLVTVTAEWETAATSRTLFSEFTYAMPFDRMDFRVRS